MKNALRRLFLLTDWETVGSGFGPTVFIVGKYIAIMGRMAVPIVIVAAIIACFIDINFLLVVAYGSGGVFIMWLFIEMIGRALMLFGNWWALHFGRRS